MSEPKSIVLTKQDLIGFTLSEIRMRGNPTNVIPNTQAHFKELAEIRLPTTGGIYSYFVDEKFPQKGFPYADTVEKIDDIKKLVMGLLRGFADFRGKWALMIFFLLFRKRLMISFWGLIENINIALKPHKLIPGRYCVSVRELYQAMDETIRVGEGRLHRIRDIICMVLEFDDAYRYRFQYTFGQLNKENFRQNPYKELFRLLSIMEEAEIDKRLRGTWKMMRKLLWLSFLSRELREGIVGTVYRMDPEKVNLDEADRYYAKLHHNLFVKS